MDVIAFRAHSPIVINVRDDIDIFITAQDVIDMNVIAPTEAIRNIVDQIIVMETCFSHHSMIIKAHHVMTNQ